MSVGDEFGLTEELYTQLIGKYVATIEVLVKRLAAKDQRIMELESELSGYHVAEVRGEASSEK